MNIFLSNIFNWNLKLYIFVSSNFVIEILIFSFYIRDLFNFICYKVFIECIIEFSKKLQNFMTVDMFVSQIKFKWNLFLQGNYISGIFHTMKFCLKIEWFWFICWIKTLFTNIYKFIFVSVLWQKNFLVFFYTSKKRNIYIYIFYLIFNSNI